MRGLLAGSQLLAEALARRVVCSEAAGGCIANYKSEVVGFCR
jgi:hypothetical protein